MARPEPTTAAPDPMPEPLSLLLVFLVGVAAAVVGAMAGGGSLLSIPLLIFLGLPPEVAIATDRFAGLGAAATATWQFARAGRIVWRHVPVLAAASLAGSLVGATALVRADGASLEAIVGVLLLVLVPTLLVRRDFGVMPRETSPARRGVGLALYLGVQGLAGFFGAGTGSLVFWILMSCLGLTVVQAAATQMVPFLVLTLSSLAVFAVGGLVDLRLGVVLLLGTAVGGWLGARLAVARGDRWVRRVFALVVVASAARLIFG